MFKSYFFFILFVIFFRNYYKYPSYVALKNNKNIIIHKNNLYHYIYQLYSINIIQIIIIT